MSVPNGIPEMNEADWTKWLWGLFAPFIWHLYKKLDKSVNRDEFNETVKSLRESHSTTAQQIREEIRDGNKNVIDQMNATVRLIVDTRK